MASLHCILMCGPLALALPMGQIPSHLKWMARTVFVWGRWFVYGILGAGAGVVIHPFSLLGIQEFWLWIAIGVLFSIVAFWDFDFLISIRKIAQKASRILIGKYPISGLFILGIANGMLPCGMVYAALAMASVSGSAFLGALFMVIFGMANSWWHLVLIFGLRIPKLNYPRLAFLGSNRVALAIVVCTLLFRLVHNLEGHNESTHSKGSATFEEVLCRNPGKKK